LRERVRWTGSHLESLKCLQVGEAEFAAIDTITYDLLRKFAPHTVRGLRILAESAPVPAPPIVTSPRGDPSDLAKLRAAFLRLFAEEQTRPVRDELMLSGFYPVEPEDYRTLSKPSAAGIGGG
jgi:ABC-type phosphate/phosphonate transport system substrate-binding protein